MRLPEKPPDDEETHKLLGQNDINSIEELRPYLNIVNSKYLHWDELPMRFKDIKLNLKLLWSYVAVSTAIKNAPSKYTRAYLYSETDNNDITYFVKFNLRQLDIALKSFEKYIEKTRSENKNIFEAIKNNPTLNFRQADVIITLGKNDRPITVNEMRERYDITYQTARTDLLGLAKLGYLHKHTRGKQFIFLLDKDKCMSTMSILEAKPPINPQREKATSLST